MMKNLRLHFHVVADKFRHEFKWLGGNSFCSWFGTPKKGRRCSGAEREAPCGRANGAFSFGGKSQQC